MPTDKNARKPQIGSFYLLKGAIFYNTFNGGLEHTFLWKKIINKIFKDIDPSEKQKLNQSEYGADRGRVTWSGAIDNKGNPIGKGEFILYASPYCKQYENEIKNVFNLRNVQDLRIDWESKQRGHYTLIPHEKEIVDKALQTVENLKNTHIASIKPSFLKKIMAKLGW